MPSNGRHYDKMSFSSKGSRTREIVKSTATIKALKELAEIDTIEEFAEACKRCAERKEKGIP